jgi:hypothetical protein
LVILEEGTLWTERYWFEYYSKVLKLKLWQEKLLYLIY